MSFAPNTFWQVSGGGGRHRRRRRSSSSSSRANKTAKQAQLKDRTSNKQNPQQLEEVKLLRGHFRLLLTTLRSLPGHSLLARSTLWKRSSPPVGDDAVKGHQCILCCMESRENTIKPPANMRTAKQKTNTYTFNENLARGKQSRCAKAHPPTAWPTSTPTLWPPLEARGSSATATPGPSSCPPAPFPPPRHANTLRSSAPRLAPPSCGGCASRRRACAATDPPQ